MGLSAQSSFFIDQAKLNAELNVAENTQSRSPEFHADVQSAAGRIAHLSSATSSVGQSDQPVKLRSLMTGSFDAQGDVRLDALKFEPVVSMLSALDLAVSSNQSALVEVFNQKKKLKATSKDDLSVDYSRRSSEQKQSASYAFKKDLMSNPLEVYCGLANRLGQQAHRASFPEFAGVVDYLKQQLNHPFVLDAIKGNKFMEHAHKLCMLELSHIAFEFSIEPSPGLVYPHEPPVNGLYPYHATIGAIRSTLDFFDGLERATKDNVPELYHSDRYT